MRMKLRSFALLGSFVALVLVACSAEESAVETDDAAADASVKADTGVSTGDDDDVAIDATANEDTGISHDHDAATTTDGSVDDSGVVDSSVTDSAVVDSGVADSGACANQTFTVTNNSSTSYVINGANNPALTLCRGSTYTFNLSVSGHPFWIKTVQGTGTGSGFAGGGLTGNGTDVGTLTFTVPAGAPNSLFYNCQFHGGMTNTISIIK